MRTLQAGLCLIVVLVTPSLVQAQSRAAAQVLPSPGLGVSALLRAPAAVALHDDRMSFDAGSTAGGLGAGPYPHYVRNREIVLTAVGAGVLLSSFLVPIDTHPVPPQGFDPNSISWSVDRDIVGNNNVDAHVLSDWTRTTAIIYPFVLALITEPQGARWRGFYRRSGVYIQSFLISQGLTNLGKRAIGRERPYTYLAVDERPTDSHYDVTDPRAFKSMPSGHASSAWTGTGLAMTEHLLVRPQASWVERASVGFVGGALAGGTAALRVVAGQHFPSDVLVGSALGLATGVTLPLVHRGTTPAPSARAWLQSSAGAVAGVLTGILIAQSM